MRVRIGSALFDGDTRQVLRAGNPVPLTRKAFDLLELLLSARPRAVTKEEIQQSLWPETFVVESNLQGLVSDLRHALGDDARNPRFIRTVWGIGYAFAGDAVDEGLAPAIGERDSSAPRLVRGRMEIPLLPGPTLLGRDHEPTAAFADASISRNHARALVEEDRVLLEDLGSKNGTFVCGERIAAPTPLDDGMDVRLGLVSFTFRARREREPTKTAG